MGGIKIVPDDLAGLRKLYLGFISSRVIILFTYFTKYLALWVVSILGEGADLRK